MDGMNAEGHGEQCEWTRESSKEFGRDDLKIGYDMLYNAQCFFLFYPFSWMAEVSTTSAD